MPARPFLAAQKVRILGALLLFSALSAHAEPAADGISASQSRPVIFSPLSDVLQQARQSRKPVLVAFLGMDWSVACKRLHREVLQSPEFRKFAEDHLLYWPVNARRKPPLVKKERATLQSLVIHFDIQSYPTLILLDPDGNERFRHGYRDFTATEYVDLLRAILPPKHDNPPLPANP